MKYENKEQLRNFLNKSTFVLFDTKNYNIGFIGNELERCVIRVNSTVFNEIMTVCNILEIKNQLI